MELMLWRWSTTVQLSSLAIIAVFFAVLVFSVGIAALSPGGSAVIPGHPARVSRAV